MFLHRRKALNIRLGIHDDGHKQSGLTENSSGSSSNTVTKDTRTHLLIDAENMLIREMKRLVSYTDRISVPYAEDFYLKSNKFTLHQLWCSIGGTVYLRATFIIRNDPHDCYINQKIDNTREAIENVFFQALGEALDNLRNKYDNYDGEYTIDFNITGSAR